MLAIWVLMSRHLTGGVSWKHRLCKNVIATWSWLFGDTYQIAGVCLGHFCTDEPFCLTMDARYEAVEPGNKYLLPRSKQID